MKVVHIGVLFPIKNSKIRVLCGAKSECQLVLLIDSKHNLRMPHPEDREYRFCRHCVALMKKIQPIGKALYRLTRSSVTEAAP